MKRILLPAIGLLASLLSAQAQFFTNGNLAVVRISGFDTTSSTGAAVFVDQYTTGGQLASSFTVPTSGSNALILNGEPYEGLLNLTPDGTHLVIAGYNTNLPYASNIISSESALVPRVAATLDAYGNFLIAASTITNFNDSAITSAASDGTNFWMCGTGPTGGLNEIAYLGNLAAPSTNQIVTNVFTTSVREVTLYNIQGTNQLFAVGEGSSSSFGIYRSGGFLISNISGALPQSGTGVTNLFPDSSATGGGAFAYDIAINPSGTIAYLADNDNGIVKFTNSASGWVSNYTISLTNAQGPTTKGFSQSATSVTADWSQNPPVVYATSGETITNRLVSFQDTNASGVDTVITLAQGSVSSTTNTFRGVRFVPGAYPEITSQPESATNDAGQTIPFSVSAIGSPTLTYQWYSNGLAISGATDSAYDLVNPDTNASGSQFYVIVSNAFGTAQSSNATATVNPPGLPIQVRVSPGSQTINAGSSAVFTATFVGATNSVSYGWTLNGAPLSDGPFGASTISGSSTPTLSISDAFATNDGDYEVFVTNSFGSGSGGPGVLLVNDPAIITNAIGATNIPNSGPVILSVAAVGTGLTYEWLLDGTAIQGANSSSYTVPNSAVTSSGSYSVVVTSADGDSVTNGPTVVSFTPLILDDTFTYADGNLFGDPGSPWKEISGTSPILVLNDRAQIAQTNTTRGTAFAQSLFTAPQSNTVMWASFTINLSTVPSTAAGVYIAHFEDTNFGFYGRIFALTSNNPALTPDLPAAAYPGTYRLGIANKSGTVNQVVELDMAPGIDYNVVEYFDMTGGFSQLSVNPSQAEYNQVYSQSTASTSLASAYAADTFSPIVLPMAAYGLREAAGCGILELDNLEVSYDWNGAGSGYAAVTANMIPELPVIGFLTPELTNYTGNPGILEVAASGIDLGYQWYQETATSTNALSDATNFQGSASTALVFSYLDATNAGSYFVVVTNEAGSVTSAVTVVSLDTNSTAPVFTVEPSNIVTSLGSTVTFTSEAVGTGPITYQWSTGDTGPNLTLTRVSTNLSGNTYSVVATGGTGLSTTSAVVTLTVNGPVITNIAYLRSLQDDSLAPTITVPASNSVTVYQVTGVVTEHTNIESSSYAEYWIQDSTAGIEFFVVDPSFRPHYGDVVSVSGVVDIFDDALELDGSAGNPAEPYSVVSTNGESQPLPFAPELIPFGFSQANPALSSLVYQGSLAVFTNCYFAPNAVGYTAGTNFGDEATYEFTNNSGQTCIIYTGGSDGPDVIGQPIPKFAYSITGPYDQFDTTYEIMLTAASEIVTAPPPAVTNLTAAVTSTNITLSWTAVPASYTYSVLSSTNLAGPWSNLQGGLWFSNSIGTFTAAVDTNIPAMFFQIASP